MASWLSIDLIFGKCVVQRLYFGKCVAQRVSIKRELTVQVLVIVLLRPELVLDDESVRG